MIVMAITEILTPKMTPAKLIRCEKTGSLSLFIEATVDAKSVFDALVARETKVP